MTKLMQENNNYTLPERPQQEQVSVHVCVAEPDKQTTCINTVVRLTELDKQTTCINTVVRLTEPDKQTTCFNTVVRDYYCYSVFHVNK